MMKFKKIASLFTSALMIGSTIGLAAAANYPSPFVKNGMADVAVVYGAAGANTDIVAATNINGDLTGKLVGSSTGTSTGTSTSVTGEAYPLFTSSSQLFLNSTLNSVRDTLTSQELPTILEDGTFEGTTSTGFTQKIVIGSNPQVNFAKMPTSDDDPKAGISFSTNPSTQPLYNASVIFDSNVNFTSSDSIGADLNLFGQKFTVGAGSTTTKLVLLKSSQTVDLTSDTNPSATVTVDGKEYTVTLISASDNDATIKVTDSSGNSDTKQISESTSKKVMGLEVSVNIANQDNQRTSATVAIGSNRIALKDNSAVLVGSDEKTVDGTNVKFYLANGTTTTYPGAIGRIDFQVAAADSDKDAIFPGQNFVDPVFGTFKVDFTGISIPTDSTTDREEIKVKNIGSDKLGATFQLYGTDTPKTVEWVYNKTDAQGGGQILADSENNPIRVVEMQAVNKSQYVVIANKDEGALYQVTSIHNDSSTATDDYVRLKNVFTGTETEYKATSEGTVTATLEGKTYTITYSGASTAAQETMQARFNAPESTGNNAILFPTMKTSKGAKVAFYQPTTLSTTNWDGGGINNLSGVMLPNGNGYTTISVVHNEFSNITVGSQVLGNGTNSVTQTAGVLTYNFTHTGTGASNATTIYLVSPAGGNIVRPALIVFEDKDDSSNYGAAIVTTDAGYDGSNNNLGVGQILRTWGGDIGLGTTVAGSDGLQTESNNDLYQKMDFWGTLYSIDKSSSDQPFATISYPKDQVETSVYVAEIAAAFSDDGSSGGSSGLAPMVVSDTEAASLNKNLIVVGGSCINTLAQSLLGSTTPLCGSDFTAKTGVSSGQFLIETFSRSGKVATLVAGYDAGDTQNAAQALITQSVDTTVGKKYTGTTATSITSATSGSESTA